MFHQELFGVQDVGQCMEDVDMLWCSESGMFRSAGTFGRGVAYGEARHRIEDSLEDYV